MLTSGKSSGWVSLVSEANKSENITSSSRSAKYPFYKHEERIIIDLIVDNIIEADNNSKLKCYENIVKTFNEDNIFSGSSSSRNIPHRISPIFRFALFFQSSFFCLPCPVKPAPPRQNNIADSDNDIGSAAATSMFKIVRSANDPENKDLTAPGANLIVAIAGDSGLYT